MKMEQKLTNLVAKCFGHPENVAEYIQDYVKHNSPQNDVPIEKTLSNTTVSQAKDNVKDIVFWGNGDLFKLICKASSKNEGWMKSTKAMEIDGVGCVVQVTTQQYNEVAEAVCFVPGVKIVEKLENDKVVLRYLTSL